MTTGVGSGRASRRRPWAAALATAVLTGLLVPGPTHAAPARVPGIDVSKWQGDIDWAAVAGTSIRFVIMRSTIGDTGSTVLSVDPRYLEYVEGATAEGLVVGAYHRANVGRQEGDAVDEADFFVDLARIEAGDVLPVLDIEDDRGLSVSELRTWVRTWVKRVHARTGVKPLLYTSPSFWRTFLGDWTWFADHGYPLWIAHWGVQEPDVPAAEWGGHGWTYWQWDVTEAGSVPGIATDIDRDRFVGPDLLHGTIASLSVTPAAGGTIEGPRIRCGGTFARCTRIGNPFATVPLEAVPGPGATFMGWAGACAGAGTTPSCDVPMLGAKTVSAVFGYPVHVDVDGTGGGVVTSSPPGIACETTCDASFPAGSTVTLTADPDSASVFDGWGGACGGGGATCDVAVSATTAVTATFASTISVEESGPGTRFTWGRANDARAIGGSYRWERRAGASVAFDVSGGVVTLYTRAGPSMGRAEVRVDGEAIATLDGYAATREGRRYRFDELGSGPHELRVVVLGTRRAVATGTRVAVDALRWGGLTRPDPSGRGAWASRADADASGAAYVATEVTGATARLGFTGTGVSVRFARGPAMGRAELRIDGETVRVVDLYAVAHGFRTVDLAIGLDDGPHTAMVFVLGAHRPASHGSAVGIDRWIIR